MVRAGRLDGAGRPDLAEGVRDGGGAVVGESGPGREEEVRRGDRPTERLAASDGGEGDQGRADSTFVVQDPSRNVQHNLKVCDMFNSPVWFLRIHLCLFHMYDRYVSVDLLSLLLL